MGCELLGLFLGNLRKYGWNNSLNFDEIARNLAAGGWGGGGCPQDPPTNLLLNHSFSMLVSVCILIIYIIYIYISYINIYIFILNEIWVFSLYFNFIYFTYIYITV